MERRRSKRISVHLEVQLSVMDDTPGSVIQGSAPDDKIERVPLSTQGAGEFFDAEMLDLSMNGARLTSQTQPPLLSRVSLAFNFEEHRHVHATALVMWRATTPSSEGHYSFGVLFEAMPVDIRVAIHKAVTTRNP